MDSIIDRLAETENVINSEILNIAHLEDSLAHMASNGDIAPEEREGLDRLLSDALTGKTFTLGFLRRVNARLAEVYSAMHNAPVQATASRNVAAVDDVVFAKSSGEAGRVLAVIGTGSPSYLETCKEYQKRYGWKQSVTAENALALYKVVHADGKEELYYDTETTTDSSYVPMPKTSQETQAVLVDSGVLKEALQLWWNLLPESERALQFSRHGSDLKILDRLKTKLAEVREDSLNETHPVLLTAYQHVKANGLAKKAAVKKAEADSVQIWSGKGYVVWFTEGDNHPYWVSDDEGSELEAFSTEKEAMDWVKNQGLLRDVNRANKQERAGGGFNRDVYSSDKQAAEEKAPKEGDKKLAVWHLNKMVMPWGPEGADPTAARDFGDLESGNVLISSEAELLKKIEERFGITGWEAVEDEPGRYETSVIENDQGYQDDNGTWIADYSLYVEWYTPAKGA